MMGDVLFLPVLGTLAWIPTHIVVADHDGSGIVQIYVWTNI